MSERRWPSTGGARIAITGGGGFLGRALITRLTGRPEIAAISALATRRAPELPRHERLRWVIGDLSERRAVAELLAEADVIVHLADRGFPLSGQKNAERYVEESLAATRAVLDGAADRQARRIVYVSTGGAVYRPRPEAKPYDEGSPTEERTPYAAVKLRAEGLVSSAAAPNREVIIIRPSNVYGPGASVTRGQGFIGVACAAALARRPIDVWGSPTIAKDFLHVSDCAAALASAALAPLPSGIFNVGAGIPTSLGSVVRVIEEHLRRACEIRELPARPTDTPWLVLDASRFREATGWRPRWTLADGVRSTLAWLGHDAGAPGGSLATVAEPPWLR